MTRAYPCRTTLQFESLELRQLMAADAAAVTFPVELDSDCDGTISPNDVWTLINRVERLAHSPDAKPDVNACGPSRPSPIDVLRVINYLNSRAPTASGEGEGGASQPLAGPDLAISQSLSLERNDCVDDPAAAPQPAEVPRMMALDSANEAPLEAYTAALAAIVDAEEEPSDLLKSISDDLFDALHCTLPR